MHIRYLCLLICNNLTIPSIFFKVGFILFGCICNLSIGRREIAVKILRLLLELLFDACLLLFLCLRRLRILLSHRPMASKTIWWILSKDYTLVSIRYSCYNIFAALRRSRLSLSLRRNMLRRITEIHKYIRNLQPYKMWRGSCRTKSWRWRDDLRKLLVLGGVRRDSTFVRNLVLDSSVWRRVGQVVQQKEQQQITWWQLLHMKQWQP